MDTSPHDELTKIHTIHQALLRRHQTVVSLSDMRIANFPYYQHSAAASRSIGIASVAMLVAKEIFLLLTDFIGYKYAISDVIF